MKEYIISVFTLTLTLSFDPAVSSLMTNGKNINIFEAVKLKTWLLVDLEGKKLIMINIMSSLCADIS